MKVNMYKNYNIFISLILITCSSISLIAQNHAPVVSNIHFSQRPDDSFLVDIYYDLYDADANLMTISLKWITDEYQDNCWYHMCPSSYGDIGAGQTSGNNKHIIWDIAADYPYLGYFELKFKIVADDGVATLGQPCDGIPSFVYGGQTYNTAQIGNQCWMKENLNVGNMVISTYVYAQHSNCTNNGIIEKYCYNNIPENCLTYGGLYDWDEMMQYSTIQGIQGICPTGWHIPTNDEWIELINNIEPMMNEYNNNIGRKMKVTGFDYWCSENINSSDECGFSALGAGIRPNTGDFWSLNYQAYFWTSSTPFSNAHEWYNLQCDADCILINSLGLSWTGASVRCIRNQ